jgi:hypothetical protein
VLTARGSEYLAVQRTKVREIEEDLRAGLGEEGFSGLLALLDALAAGPEQRLRTYLQRSLGRT